DARFYVPEKEFLLDNGAMIAWQGILQKTQASPPQKWDILPYQRMDDVDVNWN
ncbi:TPA: UGMP family protein, partial [Candidatus Woesearchaeota archaeon]|nr:UGMP family protein [Candidatus Woesearchaeota archaeon]